MEVAQGDFHRHYGVGETTFALARATAMRAGGSLVRVLVTTGLVADDVVAHALEAATGMPILTAEELCDPVEMPKLNLAYLTERSVLPLRIEAGEVVVAMADPLDAATCLDLAFATQRPISRRLARFGDIAHAHQRPATSVARERNAARLLAEAPGAKIVMDARRLIVNAFAQGAATLEIVAANGEARASTDIRGRRMPVEGYSSRHLVQMISWLRRRAGPGKNGDGENGRAFSLIVSGREMVVEMTEASLDAGDGVTIRFPEAAAVQVADLG